MSESWLDPKATSVSAAWLGHEREHGEQAYGTDEEEIVSIKSLSCWRQSYMGDFCYVFFSIVSLGLLPLASSWLPILYAHFRFTWTVPQDSQATHVLVRSLDDIVTIVPLESIDPHNPGRGWIPRYLLHASSSWQKANKAGSLPLTFLWRSERYWYDPPGGMPSLKQQQAQKHTADSRKAACTPTMWRRHRFNLTATLAELHRQGAACATQAAGGGAAGVTEWEQRQLTYGSNVLHVDVPGFWLTLRAEVFKPFIVFQIFSIAVWFAQLYIVFAIVILFLTALSTVYEAYSTRKNRLALQKLAESECPVQRMSAHPDSSSTLPRLHADIVQSSVLLPGDLVQVEAGMIIPCDLLLLAGQCVLNESMLTGESAPVLKAALPLDFSASSPKFRPQSDSDSKHRLLCGTHVLQVRSLGVPPTPPPSWTPDSGQPPPSVWNFANTAPGSEASSPLPVIAMVVGTGYATAKGEMVRSILYPKPTSFDFVKKLYFFILNLFFFFLVAAAVTLYYQVGRLSASKIILNILNIVTITIPPTLPLSLTIGLSAAFTRLQAYKIFCINPPRIINAGRANLLCFDKTGTLTRDGLSIEGVLPVDCAASSSAVPASAVATTAAKQPLFADMRTELPPLVQQAVAFETARSPSSSSSSEFLLPTTALTHALAACHGLSVLHSSPSLSSPPQPYFPELELESGYGRSARYRPSFFSRLSQQLLDAFSVTSNKHSKLAGSSRSGYGDDGWGDEDYADGSASVDGLSFVGDPLEIQMFRSSGWHFIPRSDSSLRATSSSPLPGVTYPSSSALRAASSSPWSSPSTGPTDLTDASSTIWDHPQLPPSTDLVLLPPTSAAGTSRYDSGATPAAAAAAASAASTAAVAVAPLAVFRRCDFDSELRRMSVAVAHLLPPSQRPAAAPVSLLVKGAPESIKPLCKPETVPGDFNDRLNTLTMRGNRVLALAYRSLSLTPTQVCTAKRSELESSLTFCGFLVLENALKPQTVPALQTFAVAGLRCVMVTGDNPLTAIAVARRCGPSFLHPNRRTFLLDSTDTLLASGDGGADKGSSGGGEATGNAAAAGTIRAYDDSLTSRGSSSRGTMYTSSSEAVGRYKAEQGTGVGVSAGGSTACVLTDVASQKCVALDTFLLGGVTIEEGSAAGGMSPGSPGVMSHLTSITSAPSGTVFKGADIVVTGRGFEALKQHHDRCRLHHVGPQRRSSSGIPPLPPLVSAFPPTPLEAVLVRAAVFARMSPANKKDLMLALRDLSYSVCMTGDGANDSAALKAADVGLSIASAPVHHNDTSAVDPAESAAAAPRIAAPFSTPVAHIGILAQLLKEGRCSLVTAVSMFKYMFFYGVIQTVAVMVLYPFLLELYDMQYAWADLALVFPLVLLIPAIPPRKELSRGSPQSDLWSPSVLTAVYGQTGLIILFQLLAAAYLHSQTWYFQPSPSDPTFNAQLNFNSSASFLFSNFQYVFLALAVSQSFGRFRANLLTCIILLAVLAGQFTVNAILLLAPTNGMRSFFALVSFADYPSFTLNLFLFALINGGAHLLFERFAVRHTSCEPDTRELDDALLTLPPSPSPTRGSATSAGAGGGGQPHGKQSNSFTDWLLALWRDTGDACMPSDSLLRLRYLGVLRRVKGMWDSV